MQGSLRPPPLFFGHLPSVKVGGACRPQIPELSLKAPFEGQPSSKQGALVKGWFSLVCFWPPRVPQFGSASPPCFARKHVATAGPGECSTEAQARMGAFGAWVLWFSEGVPTKQGNPQKHFRRQVASCNFWRLTRLQPRGAPE